MIWSEVQKAKYPRRIKVPDEVPFFPCTLPPLCGAPIRYMRFSKRDDDDDKRRRLFFCRPDSSLRRVLNYLSGLLAHRPRARRRPSLAAHSARSPKSCVALPCLAPATSTAARFPTAPLRFRSAHCGNGLAPTWRIITTSAARETDATNLDRATARRRSDRPRGKRVIAARGSPWDKKRLIFPHSSLFFLDSPYLSPPSRTPFIHPSLSFPPPLHPPPYLPPIIAELHPFPLVPYRRRSRSLVPREP